MSKLQEYRAFVTVVEENSLTQAARRLHRSASTISKQLAKLEQDLGVQLVDRTTQSIVVTRPGQVFFRRCKAILASVEEAERALKDDLEAPAGKLSVSVPEGLINTGLMSYLGEFCEAYPEVRFNLSVSNQLEDLIENQIDFAFRAADIADERLVAFDLTDMKMIAVASPAFLKRVNLPDTIAGVIEAGHIIVPTEINVPRAVAALAPELAGMPLELDQRHTANTWLGTVGMARAGLGVAIAADFSVRQELKDGSLVDVFPGRTFLEQKVRLMYRRRTYLPRLMELFKAFIRQKYDNSVVPGTATSTR